LPWHAKGADLGCSEHQLTPFGHGGRTIMFKNIVAVEMTLQANAEADVDAVFGR